MPLKINCLSGFRAAVFGLIICCRFTILKIFSKILRFFLPAVLIFAELPNVMNANEFLPPPDRLSQASESEKFSGGASSSEITRRSFLKRTGGATVATLVAWNLASLKADAKSNYFIDGSGTSDWAGHILICTLEPAPCDYKSTWHVADTSHPNWSSVPHVDISDTVGGAAWSWWSKKYNFDQLVDSQGRGYSFFLLHWLTYGGVIHKGDFVGACKPGGQMASTITAHFAVVQGKWTYKWGLTEILVPGDPPMPRLEPVEFVYHKVLSGSVDPDTGVVMVDGSHPTEQVRVVGSQGKKTIWMPLIVDGVTTGWVQVSSKWGGIEASPTNLSCGQIFTSVATYLPKFTLKSLTESYQSGFNLAASLQSEMTRGDNKYTGGVNGGWTSSTTVTQQLEVNSPPNTIDFALRWDHAIWETSRGLKIEKGPPMPTPRNVEPDLPPPNA